MTVTYYLTSGQKKQATLLYYFTSLNYLKELQEKIKSFRQLTEGTLEQSQKEGRDNYLHNARWGYRDTSENWANNSWSFIADFDLSISRHIADRAAEIYHVTGASHCGRGMAEYSLMWTTPNEQKEFQHKFAEISHHANYIDMTVDKSGDTSAWDDFEFTLTWESFSNLFERFPKFNVRTDLCVKTGDVPPRTGVYIAADDPLASLQFAWRGDLNGALLECSTFNKLGETALLEIGRQRLWKDGKAMQTFVSKRLSHPDFLNNPFFDGLPSEELAPSIVASCAFSSHPSKWYFVEIIEGEWDPIDKETETDSMILEEHSFRGNMLCTQNGFYFTPAKAGSRQFFSVGQIFPEIGSSYGETIWQWDQTQE
ncbi:MAG: hypothetical protein C0490_08810 [Marivirga sp.]|nr:hypothetical protein [Marivirga sp.]